MFVLMLTLPGGKKRKIKPKKTTLQFFSLLLLCHSGRLEAAAVILFVLLELQAALAHVGKVILKSKRVPN